jgi:hypothetical protein
MGGGLLPFRLFRELAQLASLGAARLGSSLPATPIKGQHVSLLPLGLAFRLLTDLAQLVPIARPLQCG